MLPNINKKREKKSFSSKLAELPQPSGKKCKKISKTLACLLETLVFFNKTLKFQASKQGRYFKM